MAATSIKVAAIFSATFFREQGVYDEVFGPSPLRRCDAVAGCLFTLASGADEKVRARC